MLPVKHNPMADTTALVILAVLVVLAFTVLVFAVPAYREYRCSATWEDSGMKHR